MRVSSYPRVLAWLLMLAGYASGAWAVEFDEKVRAPRAKGGIELKAQAESYFASFTRSSTSSPLEMVANKALAHERFELKWQIERALEDKRQMEDLSILGLEKDGSGYRVDINAFPQWQPFPQRLVDLLPAMDMTNLGPLLVARGFRESDVATLRTYLETHDIKAAMLARTLPIAISFSKIVKKYDKIKRPVGDDLVFSFLYQRGKAEVEVQRSWAEGLIRTLDDQRARVLQSYLSEMQTTGYWQPSDAEAGVAGLLAAMRLPDYEQRATAETAGVEP